jgi:tRNA A-37 threonylcarbamoyl transferase component Bud32
VADRAIPLKRSPRRTVERVEAALEPAVVVKRYHHPGAIARLFDRARAEQEFDVLRRLEDAGVGVPRPIATRRRDDHWELVTACIEGAVSLAAILEGSAPAPAPSGSIARSLAALLASAHAAGLDHPDLHPGNLLVQPDGRAWIVDVRGARVRPGAAALNLRRDLVALESATRERSDPWTRARFLLAYLRALEPRLAAALPERRALAREVERAGRIHRRESVRRARLRWTRPSSVCEVVDVDGLEGFRAVAVADDRARDVVVRGVRWRKLLAAWFAAARLCDHAIASARPLLLVRAPDPRAVFTLPAGARPLRADEEHRIVELHRALRDRALVLEGSFRDAVFVGADGRLGLGPLVGARLADLEG